MSSAKTEISQNTNHTNNRYCLGTRKNTVKKKALERDVLNFSSFVVVVVVVATLLQCKCLFTSRKCNKIAFINNFSLLFKTGLPGSMIGVSAFCQTLPIGCLSYRNLFSTENWPNLLCSIKKKMIGHHIRLRENDDLPL